MTTTLPQRSADRVRVMVPARLTWKDANGAVRFASVMTRDVSSAGIFVDTEGIAALPLYRLVHVQFERDARDAQGIPDQLRRGRVLSAVWRVGACRRSTGTPDGYALRFLVDPHENACDRPSDTRMPVAS
ncbi:MAG TPA: PilZ domain-containing protein [Vicinamibacterales bacterium]|nr:PilZ domain-containing protein [Vicinamibacterales bacterium]